jgi:tetratricopeptide (TPR) repeat protein
MGGAGKTAVAERFLRRLPGGLPVDPDVDKDGALPTPHSTFVFSFYDAPNADAFFESLQMWLEDTPQVGTLLSVGQMLFLLQQRQGLIVLDGLERVQDNGQRGEFGRLHSPGLRDFLNQLASGIISDLSVLVTSRFPLADLRDKNPRFFHPIPVNQIDIAAGMQLLRDRGVRGTDPQLEPIVEQCGRHALTVDFAGGYIFEYGHGDPATPLDLGTAEELKALLEQGEHGEQDELDENQREVLRQGYRFARIAEHYRDAMRNKDEAAMALLERICLFRLGVDRETLAAIFTGDQAVEVSGKALAALNAKQLQTKLDWLTRMRIVEATSRPDQAKRSSGTDEESPEHRSARSGLQASLSTLDSRPSTLYSIHPAVRDGFLSGISRDAALAGHEAVRTGLEVSLGDAPGRNPSDPATLDLLEEIVHHTLQSGHVREAWDFYWYRIGGARNLGWRLGVYERGERICRAFAGGQSPETVLPLSLEGEGRGEGEERRPDQAKRSSGGTASSTQQHMPELRRSAPRSGLPHTADDQRVAAGSHPYKVLPEDDQASFINEWAMYLTSLGRLAAAARCYELYIESSVRREDWMNASIGNQNLCDVWLLSGRLSRLQMDEGGRLKDETDESISPSSDRLRPSEESPATSARLRSSSEGALATADEALRLAELADNLESRAYRGHAYALSGELPAALGDFRAALVCQHKLESKDRPLFSLRGVHTTQLIARLGRLQEAKRLTEANQEILVNGWGSDHHDVPKCQLVLSSLLIERSGSPSSAAGSSADLWTQARDWALARDAKEVLCWSCLVEAQHALATYKHEAQASESESSGDPETHSLALRACTAARESGLKIARDCGYGPYHIDLLLQRARLHLLRGDAGAALDDIEVALDTGIPANEATGQPELLAANHEACGYAWAIPAGLQLRAEAQLLQAAQQHSSDSFVPAKLNELPDSVQTPIADARANLDEAMRHWQPLHDPEPERDDQNFKLDGKDYNYRAAKTHRILIQLEGGIMTQYSLTPLPEIEPRDQPAESVATPQEQPDPTAVATFDVFLSHNSKDKPAVRRLKKRLVDDYSLSVWLDQDELRPGMPWQELLEDGIRNSRSVAVLIGGDGIGPWEEEEMRAALELAVREKRPVIPVLLPNAPEPGLPMFLGNRTWVDLRDGLKKEELDQLAWGITGEKPNRSRL